MFLSKITINNFRLIVNAELDVHRNITLIVGRNNTAKTSCMSILEKVVKNKVLSYNDYPLQRRKYAFILLAQFMRKKITYEQLCKRLPLTSIEFLIDYSLDDAEDNLGALSPFIIDVDVDTTTALVKAEYSLKMDEESLRNYFHTCFYKDGAFALDPQETKEVCSTNFSKMFELVIYAINPNFAGEVTVITCDDYIGERRTDRNFKGDLPSPELKERLNGLMKHIKHSCIPVSENVKTLMITHRILAAQQGYNKLLDILKDGLRDKEDPFCYFLWNSLNQYIKL